MGALWSEWERAAVERTLRQAIVGGPDTVERGLTRLIEQTGADEGGITDSGLKRRALGHVRH